MSNYLNVCKDDATFGHFPAAAGEKKFGMAQVLDTLSLWNTRAKQRASLKQLDSRLLQDIGLTRQQAMLEAGKRFWEE